MAVDHHINLQGQHLLSSFTIILHYTNNVINHDTLPTQELTGLQTRVSFVLLLDDFPMFVNHDITMTIKVCNNSIKFVFQKFKFLHFGGDEG